MTASYHQLALDDLLGKDRSKFVASARHVAIYLAREEAISQSNLTWLTVNAAALPADVVTSMDYLVDKAPRRLDT